MKTSLFDIFEVVESIYGDPECQKLT